MRLPLMLLFLLISSTISSIDNPNEVITSNSIPIEILPTNTTSISGVPNDHLVTFNVITTFEGKIDPKNPPVIKTYIKANNKLYTIVNPDFSNANGVVKYVSVLNQHLNTDGTVSYDGLAKSQLQGNGQLSTNIQTFDLQKLKSKEEIYEKFSIFLYDYLKYILATGNPVDQELLKDLYNNYIYFGALSKGKNPQNELFFKNSYNATQKNGEVNYAAKAAAKTDNAVGGTLTYGVANINDNNGKNSLQQTFNVNYGKNPKNYMQMSATDSKYYNLIKAGSKSEAENLHKKNEPTFASVYSDGSTKQNGISDQQSQSSLHIGNTTVAYSQGVTSSIDKRKYLLKITNSKCSVDDFNGYKFISVELHGLDKYKKNISECQLLKSIYNSL